MGFTTLPKDSAFVRQVRSPGARKRAHPTPAQRSLFDAPVPSNVVDEALEEEETPSYAEFVVKATWDDLPEEERARKVAERDRVWAASEAYDKVHLGYITGFKTLEELIAADNAVKAAWDEPWLPPVVPNAQRFIFGETGEES